MISRIFKFSLWGICALAAISLAVMLLWNWLVPSIFGLVTINFWQALGLFALARILVGSFGGRRHHGGFRHKENPIHQKWAKMSPEQRKEFIEQRHRFGFGKHFFSDQKNGESEKDE